MPQASRESDIRDSQLFAGADFAAEDTEENIERKYLQMKSLSLFRVTLPKKVEKYPDFGLDVQERAEVKKRESEPLPTELEELRKIRER